MSADELVVPVEVHALVINEKVRGQPTERGKPSFFHMLGADGTERGSAEPEPFSGGREPDEDDEGIVVHWQLPEALTEGFVDPVTDETHYPLVPNRWLVVRYARAGDRPVAAPRGWIVHSDYLYNEDPDRYDDVTENSFLDPRSDTPAEDFVGRRYDLADGPWNEEDYAGRELFLTAVGSGLPLFAAFQPYHENVFSLHDDLRDLVDPQAGDSYPPDAVVSYLVTGWYSDPAQDILRTAADIPGLLPPGSDGSVADVAAALGWTPAPAARASCTVPGHGGSTPQAGPVAAILDGDEDTWFETAGPVAAGDAVEVDLGVAHRCTAVAVTFGEDPGGDRTAPGKELLASADGAAWTTLGRAGASDPDITWSPGPGEPPLLARYLRVRFTSASAVSTVVRALTYDATPTADGVVRSVYSGTALGLVWERFGEAPKDGRPLDRVPKIAVGNSTGESAAALFEAQTGALADAELFSSLYHGTLDTFDGAEGERDLAETTQRAWFSGSEGGAVWGIVPRGGDDEDPPAGPADLAPPWLARLNEDQAAHDRASAELAALRWRVWSVHWLLHLPQRPPGLPDTFERDCEAQLDPDHPEGAAAKTLRTMEFLDGFDATRLPPLRPGEPDPQATIDAFARAKGLPEHLRLHRAPGESWFRPADPVVLVEGAAGAPRPLARDAGDPLPCRTSEGVLRGAVIGGVPVPAPADPPDPGTAGLPEPVAALLAEFALLDRAVRSTGPDGSNGLEDVLADPAERADGVLAAYTAVWGQPWLPITLMWKITWFPTPYVTAGEDGAERYDWTFRAPPGRADEPFHYTWNEDAEAPPADFPESEGDVRNRLFRSRAFLAPTTVFVARAQLARYLETHPAGGTATRSGLRSLRRELEQLDILSQTLEGFNDWLLQIDGTAQVATEPAVARLTADQSHVPDGAAPRTDRFSPVRAGQFFFTDLRIVDRFGRAFDLVTSGEDGNLYDQYPVLTRSVTPNRDLYRAPVIENPERLIQLTPRLLQDTRLAHTQVPAAPDGDTPVAGWLLVNVLDRTVGVYGPHGQALGELRTIRTTSGGRDLAYTSLPHSPYAGQDDERFRADHPHLAGFLHGLRDLADAARRVSAFESLVATIDAGEQDTLDRAPEDDRLPARLIGRPVALIRTDLAIQLNGPVLTDPSWGTLLTPPPPAYPSYRWPVRLGDPYDLTDGLIGYFSSEPDGDIDWSRLHTVAPATGDAYTPPVTNGQDLALPARPADRPATRHLALLAHPHLPVHASTGILPVHAARLDADLVHEALAAIRATFRLNPLLATTRHARTVSATVPGHGDSSPPHSGPVENVLDGDPDTWYESGDREQPLVRPGDAVTVDLGSVQRVAAVRVLLGEPDGGRLAPAKRLRVSEDGEHWTDLTPASAAERITWPDAGSASRPPVAARYVRVEMTAASENATVIRAVDVTCAPDDSALVLPPLSSRFGTWTWAEPVVSDRPGIPDWDERPLVPADHLIHPDDPVPTARAGHLVLRPATDDPRP